MFSLRLLIDRLATLEPRTALTRVLLSNDASCKNEEIYRGQLQENEIRFKFNPFHIDHNQLDKSKQKINKYILI